MPVWLKRAGLVLIAFIVLVAAAAAYLVLTFDPNRYKGALIDWIQTHKQRTLSIDGPMSLSVFPRVAVSLRDVRLSEHRSEAEFASVREASLAVQIWPLLRQQLIIDRVSVSGAKIRYVRDAQGLRNMDDLLATQTPTPSAPGSAEPPVTTPPGESPAVRNGLRFDIKSVSLRGVEATVQDVPAGVDGSFAILELTIGRLADGEEAPVRMLARAVLNQPAVQAGMDLRTDLTLNLPPGEPASMTMRNLLVALDGEALGYTGVRATLTGKLGFDGRQRSLVARDSELVISLRQDDIQLENSSVSVGELVFDPGERALMLQALDIRLQGMRGKDKFSGGMEWPTLSVQGDALEGSALTGRLALTGDQQINIDFSTGAPAGHFENIRIPDLRLQLDAAQGPQKLTGQLIGAVGLRPEAASVTLAPLSVTMTLAQPGRPDWVLNTQGEFAVAQQAARWELLGDLGGESFRSDGQLAFGGERPRLDLRAQFTRLDLTPWTGEPTTAASTSGQPSAGGAKPAASPPTAAPHDVAVDLSALQGLDARFNLQAGELVYPPLAVGQAQLQGTLDKGLLRVTDFGGQVWEGRLRGQATADANHQRMTLQATGTNVNVGTMLEALTGKRPVEGRGRITTDLRTEGATVGALRSALGGQASVQIRDGAVRGINLAQLMRQARAAIGQQDEERPADESVQTDFTELSASFQVREGVAHNKDLNGRSPFLRVSGEGSIDLVRESIDYVARATLTGTPEGQGGAELAALKGVTVPVHLSGPLDAMRYRVRWSEVARQAVGNQLREQAERALRDRLGGTPQEQAPPEGDNAAPKSIEDRLKDTLRGLLR